MTGELDYYQLGYHVRIKSALPFKKSNEPIKLQEYSKLPPFPQIC